MSISMKLPVVNTILGWHLGFIATLGVLLALPVVASWSSRGKIFASLTDAYVKLCLLCRK